MNAWPENWRSIRANGLGYEVSLAIGGNRLIFSTRRPKATAEALVQALYTSGGSAGAHR